jgi:outer membrane murein-binding lipoprotein Lpp
VTVRRVMALAAVLWCSTSALSASRDEVDELRHMVRQLQQRVETLQREVDALRAESPPVERAEEIKVVREWLCTNGHVFSAAPADRRCPHDGTPVAPRESWRKVKLARRESTAEMLDARLDEEAKRRVSVNVSGTGIVQGVGGVGAPRARAVGSFDLLLTARPAFRTLFFADLEAIGGNGPDEFTGSATGLNADAGSLQDSDLADRVTLREAWVATELFDGHLLGVAGKLDMTNYFDRNAVANDETTQFVSGMFVNNPVLGQVVEGTGHQANAPGTHLAWDTFQDWRVGLGVQAPEDSGSAIGETPYVIGEVAHSTQLLGGPGHYRLWLRRNGGDDGSVGTGVSVDQAYGEWLRAFGRFGWQTGGDVRDRQAFSLGFATRRVVPRPRDETGVAYGWTRAANGKVEDLVELYHRFHLTDHLSASPFAQYAAHLAGNEESPPRTNVVLGGVRLQVDF